MFGITEYMLAGTATAAIAVGGWGYTQQQRAELATAQVQIERAALFNCSSRLQNILEDMRDDSQIDNLTDDDLTDVPARWLMPQAPAGAD